MENEFLDKVEDNAAVCAWLEKLQSEKADSLPEGYTSELQNFTHINVTQNELQELRDIWARWDEGTKQFFYQNYGDIAYLLDIKVDKHLFQVMAQIWNFAYNCFTFGEVDLVPTVEEYTTLLRCPKERKRVDIFALNIYGLVIFPKALRLLDEAVTDLFDHLEKGIMLVPAILAETFRSVSMCWKAGEGRFIGCGQLLMVWFHGHFWKVNRVSYRVFSESYSPLKEKVAMQKTDDISEEKWIEILQNLKEEDIEWRAFWMVPDEILYRCGNFDWVLLKRVNDNIPRPSLEGTRPMEEQLQVAPSELEIIRQDFEKKSSELGKRIEQLEEGKMHLKLDMEVQKSEAEKLRKRKNKVEKDLESLKTDYKKLHLSMRTEIKNEQDELRARVAELERSLCLYQNHNSVMELRASLRKIKEMKEKIEELETTLQSFEMRIEFLEANEEQWKG
ncbi:hypothetical protein PVK06_007756 [Gossypium arboreum]|uniref:DUF7745 domain-containing protein n=1 Tax=Gossypium arboreum TaxID=29729 RepID=A0ABR0QJD1_GOSAR|nr:hypothetical protein PVK06_007756 [Gossypium arboreum]